MFLDICGAFDNVIIDILLQKLASIGCPSNLIHFIKFLTYERFIFTSLSEECTISYKVVPQGVLSQLLYILYVSDILKQKPPTVSVSQYADDIALFSKNKNSLQSSKTFRLNYLTWVSNLLLTKQYSLILTIII